MDGAPARVRPAAPSCPTRTESQRPICAPRVRRWSQCAPCALHPSLSLSRSLCCVPLLQSLNLSRCFWKLCVRAPAPSAPHERASEISREATQKPTTPQCDRPRECAMIHCACCSDTCMPAFFAIVSHLVSHCAVRAAAALALCCVRRVCRGPACVSLLVATLPAPQRHCGV